MMARDPIDFGYVTTAGRKQAERRYANARIREKDTQHLPPTDQKREAALRELDDARAILEDWHSGKPLSQR